MTTSGMRLKKTYRKSYPLAEFPVGETAYLFGETERSPIMPVLHNFKHVPLEIDLSIKEFIMEFLHRQFLSSLGVFPKFTVLQVDIMFNGFTGEWDFFINPLTDSRHDSPVSNSDGNTSEET